MNLDGWTWEEAAIRQTAGVSFTFPTIGRTGFFGPPPSQAEQERTYDDLKKERDQKLERLARRWTMRARMRRCRRISDDQLVARSARADRREEGAALRRREP